MSGTVVADNSLELKLYYTRDRYTVYFLSNDGNTVLDSNQFYYGEQLSYTKQTPTMNVEDYDCEFAAGQNQQGAALQNGKMKHLWQLKIQHILQYLILYRNLLF